MPPFSRLVRGQKSKPPLHPPPNPQPIPLGQQPKAPALVWSGPNNRNTVSGAADQSCGYWGNNTGSDSLGWQERRGIQRIMGEDRWRNKELPERQKVKGGWTVEEREKEGNCVRVSNFDQSSAYLSLSGQWDPAPLLTIFFFCFPVNLQRVVAEWVTKTKCEGQKKRQRNSGVSHWASEGGEGRVRWWGGRLLGEREGHLEGPPPPPQAP